MNETRRVSAQVFPLRYITIFAMLPINKTRTYTNRFICIPSRKVKRNKHFGSLSSASGKFKKACDREKSRLADVKRLEPRRGLSRLFELSESEVARC